MSAEDDEFGDIMTDADFEAAIDELRNGSDGDMTELLKMMNENQMISWDEAERIMGDFDDTPVKSSLPPQTRPTEPDNDTDVNDVIRRLHDNDPKLLAINLNNMKRTPVPQIKRIIEALRDNTHCEKLCLANMGLYDQDVGNLIEIVEVNDALKHINLETNYLSGDFFAKLFQAALNNETLEEVKAVNQGVSFATLAEKDIIKAITQNTGLLKVSINLRLPEGRHKIENATIRNQDIRRELRRRQRAAEAAAATAAPPPPVETKKVEEPKKAPVLPKTAPVVPKPEPPKAPAKEPIKKQSIPTTDHEATSSTASSKAASPTKKTAPVEKPVEEPKPAPVRKWGKKEPPPPEVKNPQPMGVYPRSKIPSISAKLTEEEQKRVNEAAKKAEEEEAPKKPLKRVGVKPKIGAKPDSDAESAKSVKTKTDSSDAEVPKSLKTKTDSSDADKVASATEDEKPKKKKIIKKKIIVKKIVKKKKSIPTATESEGDKTATESEREDTTHEPAASKAPPPEVPKKPAPPPVAPKSRPSFNISRYGNYH